MAKTLKCQQDIVIPRGVKVKLNGRKITVTGPRGTLVKDFGHLRMDIQRVGKKRLRVVKWFGTSKELAAVNSICSHIKNMFTGLLKGYKYMMKSVYAHFPINIAISEEGRKVEVRNFLGEKYTRIIMMPEGVQFSSSGNKDEYKVEGNDIQAVSQSAASIQQSTSVKKKDIRKFLDGVYVSQKTHIVEEAE